MDQLSILIIAFALAVDAFAVAVCAGLSLESVTGRHVFRLGFHFGLFQAMMPVIGWVAGVAMHQYIEAVDHWMALLLLALVGGRMVYNAFCPEEERQHRTDPTRGWQLVMLSVATSIDALAVGLSFAMVGSAIAGPAVVIGIVAAALTVVGLMLGRRIGTLWQSRAELVGGLVLIAIGVRIVVEHTV